MLRTVAILTPLYVTLFWAIILLFKGRKQNYARHFLGLFMLVAAILYVTHSIYFFNQFTIYIWIEWIYILCGLLAFPMFYHYINLLTRKPTFDSKMALDYLPAICMSLIQLMGVLMMGRENHTLFASSLNDHYALIQSGNLWLSLTGLMYSLSRLIFAIQIVYYLHNSLKLIQRHQTRIQHFYSNIESIGLNWARILMFALLATAIASFAFNLIGKTRFMDNPITLVIPSVIFTSLLFIIGYIGNQQNQVAKLIADDKKAEIPSSKEGAPPCDSLKARIDFLFEHEKIYLRKELKIWDLTNNLNTNRTYISQEINRSYGMNFCNFVNCHRVKAVKELLDKEENDEFILEHIADKAGFGSINSFIRAFQKEYGITPGRYREERKKRMILDDEER